MPATKYAGERGFPASLAHIRSSLRLKFNGGFLTMPERGHLYHAVSGRSGAEGFRYSKARQQLSGEGPIPEGTYWVAPDELWSNHWYRPVPQGPWGNFRLTIHPFPDTETYGRGGFFIHGGAVPGSAGCIDLWSNMDRFVDDLKHETDGQEGLYIILTVDYNLEFRG